MDKVISVITEQVHQDNVTLTERVDHLQQELVDDFSKADAYIKNLEERFDTSELVFKIEELTLRLERTETQLAQVQQKHMEQSTAHEELLKMRDQVSAAEENTRKTNDLFEGRLERLEETMKELPKQGDHKPTSDIYELIDRLGKLDVRLTALEGDCLNDKLVRQNSKLKRRSFLTIGGGSK